MTTAVYVAACVLLPAAWALIMYAVFNRVHRRRKEPPPIDYMI